MENNPTVGLMEVIARWARVVMFVAQERRLGGGAKCLQHVELSLAGLMVCIVELAQLAIFVVTTIIGGGVKDLQLVDLSLVGVMAVTVFPESALAVMVAIFGLMISSQSVETSLVVLMALFVLLGSLHVAVPQAVSFGQAQS